MKLSNERNKSLEKFKFVFRDEKVRETIRLKPRCSSNQEKHGFLFIPGCMCIAVRTLSANAFPCLCQRTRQKIYRPAMQITVIKSSGRELEGHSQQNANTVELNIKWSQLHEILMTEWNFCILKIQKWEVPNHR